MVTTNESVISWQFTLTEQGFQSRYGIYQGDYYKQFLTGVGVVTDKNPPRRISRAQYALAKQLNQAQPGSQA
jgi:hypothetical protein